MYYVLVKDEQISEKGEALIQLLMKRLTAEKQEVVLAELTKQDSYEECLSFFLGQPAQTVITVDMAGFRTSNEKSDTVYNFMYCRCIHILINEPWFYQEELVKFMNCYTILVVASEWEKRYIERHFENILDVRVVPELKRELSLPSEASKTVWKRLHTLPKVYAVMAEEICKDWKEQDRLCDRVGQYLAKHKIPAEDGEIEELCALLRDIPAYFYAKKAEKEERKKPPQIDEEAITSIISFTREE